LVNRTIGSLNTDYEYCFPFCPSQSYVPIVILPQKKLLPHRRNIRHFWETVGMVIITSIRLRCRWQTRATRCLRPTVLYTDVDDQCHKLVTKTVTSLAHWPSA